MKALAVLITLLASVSHADMSELKKAEMKRDMPIVAVTAGMSTIQFVFAAIDKQDAHVDRKLCFALASMEDRIGDLYFHYTALEHNGVSTGISALSLLQVYTKLADMRVYCGQVPEAGMGTFKAQAKSPVSTVDGMINTAASIGVDLQNIKASINIR